MLKRAIIIAIFLTAITALLASLAHAAGFLDFPHKYNGCNNCHIGTNPGEPSLLPAFNCTTIDDTQHNNLCESCHEGVTAPLMKTHSSIRFGTKYGDWSVECIACHFPHKQMQFLEYGSEAYLYPPGPHQLPPAPDKVGYSNTIELDTPSPGESRMTDDQASWTPDEFQNMVLIANVNDATTEFEGLGYRIKNNTTTELILDGNIDTVKAPVGSPFAVIYGDLVKENVLLDNVIVYCSQSTSVPDQNTLTEAGAGWTTNQFAGDTLIPNLVYTTYRYTIQSNTPSSITTVETMDLGRIEVGRDFKIVRTVTGSNPVKFFNNNGTNSFADGGATYDGICEVCHTLTDHFRNDGSGPDQTHTSQGPSIPGINCTTCHFHNDGFAPEDCSRCHGFPPIEDVLNAASTGGNTGLTDDPGVTGSVTAGEHESHVNTFGYNDCNFCHHNSAAKDDPTHNLGLMVTMGFSQFSGAQQGGDYHGQTTVTYDYTATAPATSGSSNGTLTCDNIYCHSNIQGQADGTGSPTLYGQPVWNNAGSVQCGDCHKADGIQGDTSLMDSGTHTEHVGTVYNYICEKCHEGKGAGSPITHVNNDIDMVFDAWNPGASYSQNPNAAGNGYGDCLSAYCHSDGQNPPVTYANLTWGTTLPADCTGCHDNDAAAAPNTMNTGAHLTHVDDTDQEIGLNLLCITCHEATVGSDNRSITNYSNHVNTIREVDINITGETDCTDIQCHSDGNFDTGASTVYNNPSWNPPAALGCVDCHGDGSTKSYPTYADGDPGGGNANSHNAHVGTSGIFCEECHVETSTVGTSIDGPTPTLHVNQTVEVDFKQNGTYDPAETCSNTYCHGVDPSPAWGDTATALTCDDCHSGSGNNLPDSHTIHYDSGAVVATGSDFNPNNNSTVGNYIYTCGVCHDIGISHSGGPVDAGIQAGEVIFNDGIAGPSASYAPDTVAAGSDKGFPYTAGTCSTSYCHSDADPVSPTYGSPVWGGTNPETATCTWCHKNDVASGATIDSGGHLTHVNDSDSEVGRDLGCVVCHEATVSGNRTISDKRLHVNNSKDIDINIGSEITCNNIACHSDGNIEPGASTVYNNPSWNPPATLGCVDCHGDGSTKSYPSYANGGVGFDSNSHDIHSGTANNIACGECHGATSTAGTTLDGSTPSVHVDQTVDVVLSPGSYTDGQEDCTSTLCHGNGSPQWGVPWGAAIDTCTKCHGTPSAPTAADYLRAPPVDTARDPGTDTSFVNTDAEIGAHQTHLRASDLTQTVSNGLSLDVSCEECHPVPPAVIDANHLNGIPADVNGFWGTLATTNSATPSYTAPTCSGVYCHGGAMPSGDDSGLNRTPDWAETTYLDGTPAVDCKQCHGWPPRGGSSASIHSGVSDGTGCIGCHNFGINANNDGFDDPTQHIDGVLNASGESAGGSSCGTSGCHNDLFDSDPAKASMHGQLFGINYKHYMDNDATDDRTDADDVFTQSGASWYPTNYPSGTDTNLSSRRCLMCHVDHDIFSPDYNASSPGRSSNMRASIHFVPVGTDTTTYQDTDFDFTTPEGGICLSCHHTERTKFLKTPNDATKTPTVPYDLGGDITKAVGVFKKSTHAYSVPSAPYKGPDGTGTSTFKAVCLKCHNDTIGGNTGPKSAVSAQDSDGSQPAFGRHISSNDSSMAFMGVIHEQGTAEDGGTQLTLFDSTNSGWTTNQWVGYDVIITDGKGEHQRGVIVSNTANTLTLQDPGFTTNPANHPDSTSTYDLVRSPLPAQELCFSCHSQASDGRKDLDDLDWYEEESMKALVQRMEKLFVGDRGINQQTNTNRDTTFDLCTSKTAPGDGGDITVDYYKGYVYKTGAFKTVILGNTEPVLNDPTCQGFSATYTNHMVATVLQLDNNFYPVQQQAAYEILKPASHPLDNYGRHRPYERAAAPGAGGVLGTSLTTFWNMGDEGVAATGSTDSVLVDADKAYTTDMWTSTGAAGEAMYLYMQSGLNTGLSRMIQSNDATSITVSAFPNLIAAGDLYYIGTLTDSRHTSCVDCHNTHASTNNPEDEITAQDVTDTNNECGPAPYTCLRTASAINPFWGADEWKGFLLKIRKPDDHPTASLQGHEQIRFITAFNETNGTFTIATPWRYDPEANDDYEVIMGDNWVPTGQDGGRAGSGSTGAWGIKVDGWLTGTGFVKGDGNLVDTSLLTYTKVENVSDKTGSYGGDPDTGQRDLCVRCHSYYSYRLARPTVPDGEPDTNDMADYSRAASESDIAADYNPNNVAHHAVYARGNNQPIQRGRNTYPTYQNYYNPNWPLYTGTTATCTAGTRTVNLNVSDMPETVLPGWILYLGDTSWPANSSPGTTQLVFYEVTTLVDSDTVTVDPVLEQDCTGAFQDFFLTPGLGSTFVPPYGPWSILRCTDCHGSTKTDPLGPHASVNKWLKRDGDAKLKFEWYNGSTIQDTDYETVWPNAVNEKRYDCYNCHRADVYGTRADAQAPVRPANDTLNRIPHGYFYLADSRLYTELNEFHEDASGVGWSQFCRHCHAGERLGAIHGSNLGPTGLGDNRPESIRFLNGASWTLGHQLPNSTNNNDLACYTQGTTTNVSSCAKHSGSAGSKKGAGYANYDYDGY
jgi:predicted CxxxxCH...CXXCH cytochrome family protein